MHCDPDYELGLFASLYFTGFAFGSPIIPKFSDKLGRKWLFFTCLLIQIISWTFILMTKNKLYAIIGMFIFGLSQSGKSPIGFCYFQEFCPRSYHALLSGFW
jgi:MFS family permease